MITGVLAVFAAAVAMLISRAQVNVARDQIAEAQRQADHDRDGRLRAARAGLPTALSIVCHYSESAARMYLGVWPPERATNPEGDGPYTPGLLTGQPPSVPPLVMQTFERLVELLDDNAVGRRLELILRELQKSEARMRRGRRGTIVEFDQLCHRMLHIAVIYALASSLFAYSRRERDGVSGISPWEAVTTSLEIIGATDPFLVEIVERWEKEGTDPFSGRAV